MTNTTMITWGDDMNKLEIAKEIIKKYYNSAECGLYDHGNWAGDSLTTVYRKKGLTIDICYGYSYFEVFGLSNEEFEELRAYYNDLQQEGRK